MNRFRGSLGSKLAPELLFINSRSSCCGIPAKRMTLCIAVPFLMLVLSLAPIAFAQTDTGSVRGAVTDQQGRAVNGAQVTITNADTGYSRSVKTDTDGNYGFQSLPVGPYTLRVAGTQGFKTFQAKDITLHVNDNLTVD